MGLKQIFKLGKLTLKYFKIMYQLYSGKILFVDNLYYEFGKIPIIRIEDKLNSDRMELDCISEEGFDTYVIEKPISNPEYIHVGAYKKAHTEEILFIYLECDSIKARLCDGRVFDYSLSILDIERMKVWASR